MRHALITGWGMSVPQPTMTNDDLASVIDTSDEWISSRSGIKERRVSHVKNSDVATLAAKRALAAAGRSADEIDYILVATCTPDRQIPATACIVQAKLGAFNSAASDINAGCTGFIYALSMANGLIASGTAERILVIGSEQISSYLSLDERSTAVLFGDGAGAVVVEATEADHGLLAIHVGADGRGAPALTATGLGTEFIGSGELPRVIMDGQEIFKGAVVKMGDETIDVSAKAGWELEEIDLLIPHQANVRIIDAVRRRLGASEDQVYINIHKYGNTSAATIPMALVEAIEDGRVKPGSKLVFAAYGAGVTWGAAAYEWGDRVDPIHEIDDELEEPDRTALEIVLSKQDSLA